MNMVCPNEGKSKILDEIFRLTTARESFVLDLFKSNTTVDDASTAAGFTLADFTGYAQIAIARGDWDAAAVAANIGSIAKTANPVFTCTGGAAQNVYGWLLRGATSGIIYFGQNFDAVYLMGPGDIETLNPFKIQDKTFA